MKMGNGYTKSNENVYFRARKNASKYNEKLCSREGAAELLDLSVSTMADYELGVTKVVPVDKVVRMADLYNCPELKTWYCKNECPIGKEYPIATSINGLEGTALRLLNNLAEENTKELAASIMRIAIDGIISKDEKPEMEAILKKLDEMTLAISEMKLIGIKALRE
jgi:transcriptional regulator with XRE-family HTH domain